MKVTKDINLKNIIVIGDRVLIKPRKHSEKTSSGLYLPHGVQEREKIQSGYIIKTGPGFPMPIHVEDEPWKAEKEPVKYIPLQVKEGDLAIFLQNGAFEVMYEQDRYYIVPQSSILMVEREEDLL
ncbi:MAG: co-chaperone GroES family protein [Bacteroidota bacterium]|nr:co-chaperone GroES family protein [Bacteroidota bacterium]